MTPSYAPSANLAFADAAETRDFADRLPFRLAPFLRMAWATASARDRWAGPLNALAAQVRWAEQFAVAEGVCGAAIVGAPADQTADLAENYARHGLVAWALDADDLEQIRTLTGKEPMLHHGGAYHLVTRPGRQAEVEDIWRTGDVRQMAEALGYPTCCATWLAAVAGRGILDTSWAMTRGYAPSVEDPQLVELTAPGVAHPWLAPLGLRAAPHRSCSFDCAATVDRVRDYEALQAKVSFDRAGADSLRDVLAWPIEWSSLHGIVEIKTQILTLCHEGDATGTTYRVQLSGRSSPQEAARGLRFPYRLAGRRRRVTNVA